MNEELKLRTVIRSYARILKYIQIAWDSECYGTQHRRPTHLETKHKIDRDRPNKNQGQTIRCEYNGELHYQVPTQKNI